MSAVHESKEEILAAWKYVSLSYSLSPTNAELTLGCFCDVGIAEKAKQQVHVAYKGLSQLHQFDNRNAATFSVSLEQNPFPKPDNYSDKRTKAVDKVLEQSQETK